MSGARVPLAPVQPGDERVRQVFAGFAAEGREPIALYRALGHVPELLEAFAGMGRGLRWAERTDRALRELVILRVAQLTGSRYVWAHHRRMALSVGIAEARLQALAGWRASAEFEPRERAALRAAEEIHAAALTPEGFDELERHFALEELLEVVLTACHYESVARVVQALDIELEPDYEREEDRWSR